MKVLGIVSEYNPFHNGHKYQIMKAKEAVNPDFTVCVMSGNFVQRGEPAIYNKFVRAKVAANNGIDVVFELPLSYCLSSAENFAFGAVSMLKEAGVTHISFGCETDDLTALIKIADILIEEPEDFKNKLKEYLVEGISFPKAREKAVNSIFKTDILKFPNNILAVEYIKAIKKLNANITAVPIKRVSVEHDLATPIGDMASSTAVRNMIRQKNSISHVVPEVIHEKPVFADDFNTMLTYKLRSSSTQDFLKIPDVNEGLENAFVNAIKSSVTLDEIVEKVKSKRYTMSIIKRILFSLLLDIPKDNKIYYLRVLACSKNGQKFLPYLSEHTTIPIVTSVNRFLKDAKTEEKEMMNKEIYATNVYSIINNEPFNLDFKNKI